jgi:hypothetical protein
VPDWRVIVVAGRSHIPGALIVVVVGLELGVVMVPAVRCNMPLVVADLALGD